MRVAVARRMMRPGHRVNGPGRGRTRMRCTTMGKVTGRWATCPCGEKFWMEKNQEGRKKFCSKPCFYKYRNPTWLHDGVIQPGERRGMGTEFKKGERRSPATEFQPGVVPHNFKGDRVGYDALHDWVKRHAHDPGQCEECGHDGTVNRLEWANRSGEYQRDLTDWARLCSRCHGRHDREIRGAMRRRFPDYADKGMMERRAQRARGRQ